MLFCLLVKNFAENNVRIDNVICIAFIDYFGFNLYIYIRTLENFSYNNNLSDFLPLLPVNITYRSGWGILTFLLL